MTLLETTVVGSGNSGLRHQTRRFSTRGRVQVTAFSSNKPRQCLDADAARESALGVDGGDLGALMPITIQVSQ